MLDLKGSVNLFHDLGYELHTARASIDMDNNVAAGDSPIQGQGAFGQINAAGFRLLESGERIIFTGKARLLIHSTAPKPKQGKKK
jgi:lipopolysaccharide export system protein LptC